MSMFEDLEDHHVLEGGIGKCFIYWVRFGCLSGGVNVRLDIMGGGVVDSMVLSTK